MKKRLVQTIVVIFSVIALLLCGISENISIVEVEEDPVALSAGTGTVVQPTKDDLTIIPDKYNTGATGYLKTVGLGDTIGEIEFSSESGGARNAIDFRYRNTTIVGTIAFDNYDFSAYPVAVEKTTEITRKIKLVFNNCKFSGFSANKEDSCVTFEFNNCTIESFSGSNATFNNCKFGGSYYDGMNPFRNVEVNNCFFCDMGSMKATGKEIHTDGVQMYGATGVNVKNVTFMNCRFEIPPIAPAGSTAGINACIMIQLEFANAETVTFSDCIVNGGGYSIYAWDKDKGFTLENVNLKEIRVGCAKIQGTIYPRISSGVSMNHLTETSALYVASVWKEDGKTHFSVSNDTNQERRLLIYTDQGKYEYVIPACKKGSQMTSSDVYSEMPFDLDIVVPADCQYAICFDNTFEGCASQIRFVNWSKENVYLSEEQMSALFSGGEDILYSGICGDNVEFVLNKAGELTLQGSGKTYSYNSAKKAPWSEYSDLIRSVKVENGIESLGEQLFQNCSAIQTVDLPDTLTVIGKRAFAGCMGITSVVLPAGIKEIGAAAFCYSTLKNIYFEGENLNGIEMNGDEEEILQKVHYVDNTAAASPIVIQGSCGNNVSYVLTGDGILQIKGIGATYNYNSVKVAPWYEYRDSIKKVQIGEGIVKIGEQLFRNCNNLTQVELPSGIEIIGKNAFISCKSLHYVVFPQTLREIQSRAFADTGIIAATFCGTYNEWNDINVASYNDIIIKKLICNP